MARLRRFFAEAPIFFIAVVVGVALMFKVAIGWAKSPSAEDAAKDPTLPSSTAAAAAQPSSPSNPAKTATPAVTPEPRPAATATVPSTPRKRSRPHR